jgi:VIT1/CCC1 family predicted Fe2+/Mn2+ transporter
LLADGLSMAVSNYESIKAHNEFIDAMRREEERHIEQVPEGEREEIRQIFAQKGFADAALEHIVQTITADRRLWIETMLAEEHGLHGPHPNPLRSGAVTFAAFVLIGVIPLLPLLITTLSVPTQLYASVALAAVVFFAIGSLKSLVFGQPAIKSGLATLLTGGAAAGIAYVVGYLLRSAFGIAG